MTSARSDQTRTTWLETLARHKRDVDGPVSEAYWSEALETCSRDQLISIQNDKLSALAPFLYENSAFYRARFDRLGLAPTDIASVDDLVKWPVIDKSEMMEDAEANPPYGTYSTIGEAEWADRGWMLFSSSGSTGTPRVFRYTHVDRAYWEWANARSMRWASGAATPSSLWSASGRMCGSGGRWSRLPIWASGSSPAAAWTPRRGRG